MDLFLKVDTAVGTEYQHVVRFMTSLARKTRRLGIRPETCPPLETAHSQDPRYVLETCLFLGLFGVTLYSTVAVVALFGRMAPFGTVLTLF